MVANNPNADASMNTGSNGNTLVTEHGATTSISIIEDNNTRTVIARNLSTGAIDTTVLNKTTGLIHSPYTNAYIDASAFSAGTYNDQGIQPLLNAPARTYERFEFSWQSIRNFGGIGVNLTNIVSMIVSVVGISIPKTILDTLEGILSGMSLVPDDPNHGIYVVMVMKRWYENGKLVKAEYGFDEIGLY